MPASALALLCSRRLINIAKSCSCIKTESCAAALYFDTICMWTDPTSQACTTRRVGGGKKALRKKWEMMFLLRPGEGLAPREV